MNMGDLHKKEPTGKTLLQRKAQWAGLSKNAFERQLTRPVKQKDNFITLNYASISTFQILLRRS